MKKIIALLLSVVMTLALFTVGSNAIVFSDAGTISPDHKEAVEIMASLGVLKGDETQAFAPRNTLTRAEAAKIITYMLLGTESADRLTNDTPVFDDVPANFWGAPYIAFCVSEGIVNGNGDGTFEPDAKLTGFAFAKMLLGVIGFDGDYTGGGWQVAVLQDVNKTESESTDGEGLLEVLDTINLGDEITREQASQMAFNALFYSSAEKAEYTIRINNGDAALETAVKDKKFDSLSDATTFLKASGVDLKTNHNNAVFTISESTETLAEENFEVKTLDGYVVRNSGMSLDEFTTVRDDNGDDHKFNLVTTRSQFGHYITVYYQDEWTWETGDTNNELKGVTYTYIDQTKAVAVGKDGMTEKELKTLLGVDELDTTAVNHYHYMYQYDYSATFSPFTRNLDDTTKWDVISGTVLLRQDENDDYYVDGFVREGTLPKEFFITLVDEEEEIYNVGTTVGGDDVVKMDSEDPDENYDKTLPDSYGNSVSWLDYIDNEDGIPKYNSDTTGEVIMYTTVYGDLYGLASITKFVGTVEKVQLRDKYEGDSYITISGKRYVLPESYSTTSSNVIAFQKLAQGKAQYVIGSVADRRPQLNANLEIGKEYVFYLAGRLQAFTEVEDDSELIFPTKLYCIDTFEDDAEVDEYGDAVDQEDRYNYFLQGVNIKGEEVKLPVAWDYSAATGKGGDSAYTFLKASKSTKGYTEDGIPSTDYDDVNFIVNDAAFRTVGSSKGGDITYIPCLYSYTMKKDDEGVSYAHFEKVLSKDNTLYEDPDGEFAVELVDTALDLEKDDHRITLDNTYLLSSGYSVVTVNDENGSDLRIKTAENTFSQIGTYTVLYGEKDKYEDTDKYTLKTAFNMKSSLTVASDELIFVGTDFSDNSVTTVTYKDKNGKEKTETAYEQYVYIGGEGKWILTAKDSDILAGNLYEYEINEYSGLYEKFELYTGDDWYTGIGTIESNNSLITFGDIAALEDCDVSGAEIVNTTDYTIKDSLTKLAEDEKHTYSVAVKLNDDDEVETVYVYGIFTALDFTYDGDVVEEDATITVSAGADTVISFRDKNSAQGIKAFAYLTGATNSPIYPEIDTSAKTLTFSGLSSGTYKVVIKVSEENCGTQSLTFKLKVN